MSTTAVELLIKTVGGQKLDQLNKKLLGTGTAAVKASNGIETLTGKVSKSGAQIKRAANGLEYWTDAAGRARKANGQFVTTAEQAAAGITKTGDAAKKARGSVGSLTKTIGKLGAAFAAFKGVQGIITVGVDAIESERRIKALAGAFGEVQEVQLAAQRAAEKFGLSQREANKQFAQIYARLRPIGIEVEQIESAFNGFNTAARLSGTSAQEASSAWLQLSQALGSGVLRGEELNSVFEQTPTVVQAIAREMNAPIGQIRQLAADGEITSDIVLRALNRLERDGVDQLAEALNGPRQKFKDFSNSVEKLSNALATTVLPELTSAISEVGDTILLLEGPIVYISNLLSKALGEVNSLIRQISKPAAYAAEQDILAGRNPASAVTALTGLDPFKGAKELFGEAEFEKLKKQADEYAKLRNQNARDVFVDLAQDRLKAMQGDGYIKSGLQQELPPTSLTTEDKKKGGAGPKAIKERAKSIKELLGFDWEKALGLMEAEKQLVITQQQTQALSDGNTELYKQLESARQYVRPLLEIEALEDAIVKTQKKLTEYSNDDVASLKLKNQLTEFRNQLLERQVKLENDSTKNQNKSLADDVAAANAFAKKVQGVKAVNKELTAGEQLLNSAYSTVTSNLTSGIQGLIDGTKEWSDILGDILGQLGQLALQFAFKSLGGGIGIPGLATGGTAEGGQPYIVGEKGPELFIPGVTGTVTNNDQFEAARDAMSGSSSGSSSAFSENADAIAVSNSYSRERTLERERSESITSAGSMVIETQVINSTEYATVDQLRQSNAATAKQARAQVFSDMKNRPAIRRQVGVK